MTYRYCLLTALIEGTCLLQHCVAEDSERASDSAGSVLWSISSHALRGRRHLPLLLWGISSRVRNLPGIEAKSQFPFYFQVRVLSHTDIARLFIGIQCVFCSLLENFQECPCACWFSSSPKKHKIFWVNFEKLFVWLTKIYSIRYLIQDCSILLRWAR